MTHAVAAIVDPAWAGLVNTFLLVGLAFYLKNEITALRAKNDWLGRELVRTAKGSETRAENAAAEITVTKNKVEEGVRKVDEGVAQMIFVGRRLDDKLAHLRGEWDRLDDARRDARHDRDDR